MQVYVVIECRDFKVFDVSLEFYYVWYFVWEEYQMSLGMIFKQVCKIVIFFF